MARELKMFFVFGGMLLGGVVLILGGFLALPSDHVGQLNRSISPLQLLVVAVGFFLAVYGGCLLESSTSCCLSDFRLALRWRFIIERPFKEFPFYAKEREDLRGWAERLLTGVASQASCWFDIRDEVKKDLSKLELEMLTSERVQSPSDLPKARKERYKQIADKKKIVASYSRAADSGWKYFLKRFDFFRDMGMLPINPAAQTAWGNPNDFRLHVFENQNTPYVQTRDPAE